MRLPTRQRQKALTFIEVMIVMLIIAALSGVVFIASNPAREKARQASCAGNLRQIHAALMMYSEDNGVTVECPGYDGLSMKPFVDCRVLDGYLKSRDVMFCPEIPASRFPKYASSYQFNLSERGDPKDPIDNKLWAQQIARQERLGMATPLVICHIHDEMYYLPRELDSDPVLTGKFVVELELGGQIYTGRRQYSRNFFFTQHKGRPR